MEEHGYQGSRHFDAHAYRTEDYGGVKDFALGCMRTYLILKEKARQWKQDKEIQALLVEINSDREKVSPLLGAFSPERATSLKNKVFNRETLGARGLSYERLDQLTVELLLGVR